MGSEMCIRDSAKYGCIYADPPWDYIKNNFGRDDLPYETTSQFELLEMASVVQQLSAENAQLHSWCTAKTLQDALSLMEAWGFEYRSQLVWTKPHGISQGDYWANAHEILLLGVKGGNCPFKCDGAYPSSVFEAPSGEHSKNLRAYVICSQRFHHLIVWNYSLVSHTWDGRVEDMRSMVSPTSQLNSRRLHNGY